jgi:hypothetical protein
MMLLGILLDAEDERISIAWNVCYDVYLGEKSLAAIESQSSHLLTLSETMETWSTSQFGQRFRIVNFETLQACREIWKQYQSYAIFPTTHRPLLNKVVQRASTYEKHWPVNPGRQVPIPPLTASFGLSIVNSDEVAIYLMNQYWNRGVTDPSDTPSKKFLNPMLLYTRWAKEKFVVERNTSPLSIYHLREASQGFEQELKANVAKTVALAKSQFRSWCAAFREFIGDEDVASQKLVFRFVTADPITFCLAVQQNNSTSGIPCTGPSNTWSGTPLVVDKDSVPAQFNTIDTSTLVDSIGCINILMATVPLLQRNPTSTLITESYDRPYSEETVLLNYFLCKQPTWMYSVFGVAPLGHLTCISTTGRLQDSAALLDFAGNRPAPIHIQLLSRLQHHHFANLFTRGTNGVALGVPASGS